MPLQLKGIMPWPPIPEDVKEDRVEVSDDLYSLLLWITARDNTSTAICGERVQAPTPDVHDLPRAFNWPGYHSLHHWWPRQDTEACCAPHDSLTSNRQRSTCNNAE